jgi:hypothetical protein
LWFAASLTDFSARAAFPAVRSASLVIMEAMKMEVRTPSNQPACPLHPVGSPQLRFVFLSWLISLRVVPGVRLRVQHVIRAPKDGVVDKVLFKTGDFVDGAPLRWSFSRLRPDWGGFACSLCSLPPLARLR